MTTHAIDYPAELERIARAALHPRNPGEFVGAMDGITLREAASELARLTLSESTLRGKLQQAAAEVEELCEELDGFRHPYSRSTGRAGDPA